MKRLFDYVNAELDELKEKQEIEHQKEMAKKLKECNSKFNTNFKTIDELNQYLKDLLGNLTK